MRIFKEKAGVISEKPIWIASTPRFLYTADTFCRLVWILTTEWKHDKHLVG